jgi:hypothetical protein
VLGRAMWCCGVVVTKHVCGGGGGGGGGGGEVGGRLTKYVFSITDMWGESVNGMVKQLSNFTKQLIV